MMALVHQLFERRTRRAPPDPRAVFARALAKKNEAYAEIRRHAAQTLYLRNKLEGELFERRAAVARLHHQARIAARRGHEGEAIRLLEEKNRLSSALKRAESEANDARREADEAKRNLQLYSEEIRSLERERASTLVAMSGVELRRRLQALRGEGVDADLEAVRARTAGNLAQLALDRELGDPAASDTTEPWDADFHEDARIDLARIKLSQRALARGEDIDTPAA